MDGGNANWHDTIRREREQSDFSLSAQFMEGSEIDFVDDLIGQSFQIQNPNAVASCGCGTSFAL